MSGYKSGCRCEGCRREKSKENAGYKTAIRKLNFGKLTWERYHQELTQKIEREERRKAKAAAYRAKCEANRKRTQEERQRAFIKKSAEVHGGKYDYSLVEYKNSVTHVTIICPDHGPFRQQPEKHKQGRGCPKCGRLKSIASGTYTREAWIAKAVSIHGNQFDYSLAEYKNSKTPVTIICRDHGEFQQLPEIHIKKTSRNGHTVRGHGCPMCKRSRYEDVFATLLLDLGFQFIEQWSTEDCRGDSGYKLRFDFFLSDHDVLVEIDGPQHHEPVACFGGEEGLKNRQRRDQIKAEFAESAGLRLVRIATGDTAAMLALLSELV